MADSEKGASTTPANPKEKSPLLDEDIGNDFLSSWKSKDDAMDFSFEPISKGNKKSTMSFESLDMDFNLDAGFGKLSSFKADMSDLDFSSPPNKSSKPKERSEEKISTGNRHGKEEDPLNFNFDFDGLDSFDFGPSLKKAETKSTKKIDGKEVASEARESQGSKVNLTKGFDAFDDDIAMERPVSETIATQKVKTTASDVGDFNSMNEDCPTKSATFRTSAESNVEQTSPGTTKESGQEKHLLEEEMFTEPSTERVIEDLSVQSADEKDTVTNSILEQQMGSSSIGRSDDAGGLKNGHDNMDTKENLNHDNLQCKDLPLSITASEKDSGERNKSSIDPSQENMGRTVKSHDDLDVEDASTTSVSKKTVHTPDNRELQNSNSTSLVPLDSEMALDTQKDNSQKTQTHCEPVGDILATRKEKEEGGVRSKYFKRSEDSTTQKEHTPSSEINVSSISTNRLDARNLISSDEARKEKEEGGVRSKYFKRSEDSTTQKEQAPSSEINVSSISTNRLDARNLISSDEVRVVLNAKSAHTGSKLDTKLPSCNEEVKDGNSVIMGSGQKLKSPSNIWEVFDADGAQSGQKILANSRLQVNEVTKREPNSLGNVKSMISSRTQVEASVSNVKTPNSSGPTIMNSKVVVPRIESLRNTRIVSAEGNKLSSLKDGLKKPDSPILKSSRTTGANNDAPGATLQRQTSALRNTTKNMEALRNTTKNMEALRNSAPKISHPAEIIGKKTPQTPSLKRKSFEMSNARDSAPLKPLKRLSESPIETRNVKEHSKDTLDKLGCIRQTKTNTTEHLKSVPEVPRDVNMKEPEILLSMEDNGNVEKAEAYAKDLDDICIMLRKKQEEAKELLLRAIVNNNNLLMLYHPIHEEKIRRAQDFAAKLMSKLTISEA